jgi:hypothetical protein
LATTDAWHEASSKKIRLDLVGYEKEPLAEILQQPHVVLNHGLIAFIPRDATNLGMVKSIATYNPTSQVITLITSGAFSTTSPDITALAVDFSLPPVSYKLQPLILGFAMSEIAFMHPKQNVFLRNGQHNRMSSEVVSLISLQRSGLIAVSTKGHKNFICFSKQHSPDFREIIHNDPATQGDVHLNALSTGHMISWAVGGNHIKVWDPLTGQNTNVLMCPATHGLQGVGVLPHDRLAITFLGGPHNTQDPNTPLIPFSIWNPLAPDETKAELSGFIPLRCHLLQGRLTYLQNNLYFGTHEDKKTLCYLKMGGFGPNFR